MGQVKVKTINGMPVENVVQHDENWAPGIEFVDICSSGQGMSDIWDSTWHKENLTELFKNLSDEEKIELFVWAVDSMSNSEGWALTDVNITMALVGIETCELEFEAAIL